MHILLKPGKYFKLEITLNNGEQYVSAYDTLLLCPDIDSIYYERQEIHPDDPIYNVKEGIQFYIDFDATGNYSRNYRWEFIETWEYHAAEPIRYYYDPEEDGIKDLMTYDYSLFKCWKSSEIKNIFTYSTFQTSDKKVTALPLNFVTNEDNRLTKKYSVLIQQYTLSDIAFKYWNHLQQSKATGGLYESQPYRIEGNIKNVNDANEAVIGLFCVSSVKSKRFTGIFYSSPNRDCNKSLFRNYEELLDFLHSDTSQLPIYLLKTYDLEEPFIYVDQQCFDCTKAGGDTIKPEYW